MGKGKPCLKSPDQLLSSVHAAIGSLLPVLFESPEMDAALLDSQFRFRAINGALAAMNGLPVSSHIGKKLRYALGSSAPKVEDLVRQILETGEPIWNRDLTAKLPCRLEVGHWVETSLPIRDLENRVIQVAVLVVELTGLRSLEVSLNQLIGNLLHVRAGLQTELQFLTTTGHCSDGTAGLLPRAIELIEDCIGMRRASPANRAGMFLPMLPCCKSIAIKFTEYQWTRLAQVLMAAVNTGVESCLSENTKY